MMNSTKNLRNTKRVIGLGLAALSMSLLGTVSHAQNTTAGTAWGIPVNTGLTNFIGATGNRFFFAQLYARRSYEFFSYPATHTADCVSGSTPIFISIAVSTDSTFTTSLPGVASTNSGVEGSPGVNYNCDANNSARFTVPTTGFYYIRATAVYGTGNLRVVLRETTLFSPWLSKAAGFEGFIELHNNTSAAVSVTLTGHDSTGAQQGAGLTFSIPANATMFKTGAEIGVPVDVAAGVVLTHNGSFGAISGNITTLNGANGLSFDSAFAPRTDSVRVH